MTNVPSIVAVTNENANVRVVPVSPMDLTLDQWRPITEKEFVATLAGSSYYDGEFFLAPVAMQVELSNGNAIVFATCNEVVHEDTGDRFVMTAELMILEIEYVGDDHIRPPKVLCFVKN